jgi:2-keto-4-pentenoate hydratase
MATASRAAIVGSANTGTDLMRKMSRSTCLRLQSMVGVDPERDGLPLARRHGVYCLEHPLNGAAWLARQLAASGSGLSEGDVILTGALGPIVTTTSNTDYLADFGEFGCVRTAFGWAHQIIRAGLRP